MPCLWPQPQTSGIPSARDRPGWEAPTPVGFPQGPVGSRVLLGLCEGKDPIAPHGLPLETLKSGTTASEK